VLLPSQHFSSRNGQSIKIIVIHATAGTDSRNWLVHNPAQVSIHVLIQKDGTCYRMVDDIHAAHHVGYSAITIDGISYGQYDAHGCNEISLGVELENLNDGHDPYPEVQLAACRHQIAEWQKLYGPLRVVTHRDIDTQGKTDPHGLTPDDFVESAGQAYDEHSSLTEPTSVPFDHVQRWIVQQFSPYTTYDLTSILGSIWKWSTTAGLNPLLVLAQNIHESSENGKIFGSWWAQRPRRNGCGFGVTGSHTPLSRAWYITVNRLDYSTWAVRDSTWYEGISFPSWELAIQAQVGRLLLYTGTATTQEQKRLAQFSTQLRTLSSAAQHTVRELKHLGAIYNPANIGKPRSQWIAGWAWDGEDYGARIADIANRIVSEV